jgi:hypothetical protein
MKTVASLACLFGAAIAMPAAEQTRQEQIDEINSTPGVLWQAAVNPRFAGEPVGASAVPSPPIAIRAAIVVRDVWGGREFARSFRDQAC